MLFLTECNTQDDHPLAVTPMIFASIPKYRVYRYTIFSQLCFQMGTLFQDYSRLCFFETV